MKTTKQPGASPEKGALSVAEYDWSQYMAQAGAPTGFENVHADDLGIPFLGICQANSPEFNKTDANYQAKRIEGIGPGDIFNNLSREIYHKEGGTPMVFLPCGFEKVYVEWKPRNQGGGLVKIHKTSDVLNECSRNERNQDIHKVSGNLIATTFYFNGYVLRGQEKNQVIIGMTSTQIKKARAWLNTMMAIKFPGPNGPIVAPMFSHTYLISTQGESNEDGSWYGWKIVIQGIVKDPKLISDAKEASRYQISMQRAALPTPSEHSSGGDAPAVFA